MKGKVLVLAASVLVPTPAAATEARPAEPGSVVVSFDCRNSPVAVVANGELVFSQEPDPTCPVGSGYDLKMNKKV